jgi:hypothetical protein
MKFRHLCYAAAILVSASSTAMAARPIVRCPINAIDDQARTFSCNWHRTNWTYKTTERTTYWIGRAKASWSDLRVGANVRIKFHRANRVRVADVVRIQAQKSSGGQ